MTHAVAGLPEFSQYHRCCGLKMEVLVPAPADCEVWSVMKCLYAERRAPMEIHHTGLVFGEFRVQIPVLTKLIGVLIVVSLSNQGKSCVGFILL